MGMTVIGAIAAVVSAVAGTGGAGVLGPDGYQALKLGMSEHDALATGLLTDPETINGCDWYRLADSEGDQNPGDGVIISPATGVVSIPGTTTSSTPEGITMGTIGDSAGSTVDDVVAAYPRYIVRQSGAVQVYEAPVPQNAGAHYWFVPGDDGHIKDMLLATDDDGGCGLG
jgi:hypothetical protein